MPVAEKKAGVRSPVAEGGKARCRPTRYGWIFLVVLLGMLVGSTNYNNNLGFLFTFLLVSMAVVSLVHSRRNISAIHVESVETWPVFEGQTAVFRFHVREVASPRVAVCFKLPGFSETVADLEPGRKIQVSIFVPAARRGVLAPGELSMGTVFPFGLVRFESRFDLKISCAVYPRPVPLTRLTTRDLLQAHAAHGRAAVSQDDFKGLRTYRPGDPIQRIFWKAYSRGQGVMIKDFAGTETPSLLFSWHKLGSGGVEKKLSALCGMVLKAHGLNLRYGLQLPDKTIFPDRNERHKHRCLLALASF